MRLSIQRLRWVLAAGALLLVVVLAVYIGYGRYRAISAYRRILAHSGVSISHDTNGVTYSQSVGGKKIFTLRAARETSLGDGRWALHDADLLLYTRDPAHPDHIYGKDFQYDQNQGVARALGEVFMDLQAPGALAGNRRSEERGGQSPAVSPAARQGAGQGQIIHVRTSGLVYLRKLGLVATDRQVEFQFGGMQCTSVGAEFNTGQDILHLLSHVTMDGLAHGKPVHLTAVKADLDRTLNVANLTQPLVISQNRTAKSDRAVVNLREDGSIEQAHGMGEVALTSGTQQVTAERLDAALSPQSVPETARLSGNVLLADTSQRRPMHGAAEQVDAAFNAQGAVTSVIATGPASLSMTDHTNPAAGVRGIDRHMEGEKIVALFVPGTHRSSSRLNEVHATGAAKMGGQALAMQSKTPAQSQASRAQLAGTQQAGVPPPDAAAPGVAQFKTVQVAADDLRVLFVAAPGHNQVQPQRLYGTGHTLVQQDAPLGEQEISHGDTLDATFASGAAKSLPGSLPGAPQNTLTIVSALQTGHVTIYNRSALHSQSPPADQIRARSASGSGSGGQVSTGSAQRAAYDGSTEEVTLSGDTELASGHVSLRAPTVVLDQETGDAEARGGVQTTMIGAAANAPQNTGRESPKSTLEAGAGASPSAQTPAVTHVLSATATFQHDPKLSEFRGTDAQPARIWQDASQVQAAILTLDGERHTFSARPASAGALVHAVFAGSRTPGKPDFPAAAGVPARAGPESAPTRSVRSAHSSRSANESAAGDYALVASPKMDYNDLQREATFSGGVQIDGMLGQVRGQRAAVFLAPAFREGGRTSISLEPGQTRSSVSNPNVPTPFNGSLDRIVVSGDVQMEQPGRRGTGEQLLYTAATDSYVLTGSPGRLPHIVDAQQGSVTGAILVFGPAGSTIVVAGGPAASKSGRGRVRTETEVMRK